MKKSLKTTLQSIKAYIENRDKMLNHVIFLDRHGEVDFVSDKPENEWQGIADEAGARSGGPYFEILSICEDERFITGQSIDEYQNGIDDEVLQLAIEDADDARDIFYKERAEEFGSSAYPKGVCG